MRVGLYAERGGWRTTERGAYRSFVCSEGAHGRCTHPEDIDGRPCECACHGNLRAAGDEAYDSGVAGGHMPPRENS